MKLCKRLGQSGFEGMTWSRLCYIIMNECEEDRPGVERGDRTRKLRDEKMSDVVVNPPWRERENIVWPTAWFCV